MKIQKTSKQEYFINVILQKLNKESGNILKQWNKPVSTSTRHFFLDNLLPSQDVEEIYAAFPRDGNNFFDQESFREKKRTSAALSNFDPLLSDITYAIQDPRVVDKVSKLCSMKNIEPDPNYMLGDYQ